MKRMFALLLSLTMVFSLTACGGGNEESSSGGSEASGETITIKLPHLLFGGDTRLPTRWKTSSSPSWKAVPADG